MSAVFYFTAVDRRAQDHYRRMIERPVPVREIGRYEAKVAAELTASGLESAPCWGSVPGAGNRSCTRCARGRWQSTCGVATTTAAHGS